MTLRYTPAPTTPGPARRLALAAAEAARRVPGVAYLSPGVRGGVVRRARRRPDEAAGVKVTIREGGWHVRVHLAVYEGHNVASVARAVRAAVVGGLRSAMPTRPDGSVQEPFVGPSAGARAESVAVGVVVTAVLAAPR
ncbi:MAG: Asp23/Gls24 family envelope stress response protein [Streptomycetaceae bacterium]|nr:Asp23/Gls24 family envelope stress response protein [Streptomycetaceae bacterium]